MIILEIGGASRRRLLHSLFYCKAKPTSKSKYCGLFLPLLSRRPCFPILSTLRHLPPSPSLSTQQFPHHPASFIHFRVPFARLIAFRYLFLATLWWPATSSTILFPLLFGIVCLLFEVCQLSIPIFIRWKYQGASWAFITPSLFLSIDSHFYFSLSWVISRKTLTLAAAMDYILLIRSISYCKPRICIYFLCKVSLNFLFSLSLARIYYL